MRASILRRGRRLECLAFMVLASAALVLCSPIAGQERTDVRRGDRVRVVLDSGEEVEGRVDQARDVSLVIRDGSDERIVSRSRIRQAWVATSSGGSGRNVAILLGAGFGTAAGYSFFNDLCDSGCSDSATPYTAMAIGAFGGALLGMAVAGLMGGPTEPEWAEVTEGVRGGNPNLQLGLVPAGRSHGTPAIFLRVSAPWTPPW